MNENDFSFIEGYDFYVTFGNDSNVSEGDFKFEIIKRGKLFFSTKIYNEKINLKFLESGNYAYRIIHKENIVISGKLSVIESIN